MNRQVLPNREVFSRMALMKGVGSGALLDCIYCNLWKPGLPRERIGRVL